MKPTSRNNGHLRSDDGHTDTHTDRHTPNPLIDSAHPTGWAESISGNGVCQYVCMYVITSKMINKTARRLYRPL